MEDLINKQYDLSTLASETPSESVAENQRGGSSHEDIQREAARREEAGPEEAKMTGPMLSGMGEERDVQIDKIRNEGDYGGVSADKVDGKQQSMWGNDYTTMSLGDKAKRSLIAGVGQVATETGDMLQFFGGAIPGLEMTEDNLMSSFFHKIGDEIENENLVKQSVDLENFTWGDLGNIEFWATDVAKQIPNLAIMVATSASGAGLAKTAFSKAVTRGMANGAIKGTATQVAKIGAAKGLEIGGKGLAGKLTTATAKNVAGAVGGGVTMNLLNSSMIAGDAVNQALDRGLTKEQAEWVGANTFMDNSKWMVADMVSWGITFGGLNKGLLKAAKGVEKSAMRFADKLPRGGFRVAAKAGIKGTKIGGIASLEGMEEQFQEVYEDWVVNKNIAEAQGKGFDSYWDYFNSEEVKRTRGIAFAAGLFGAAIPTSINELAEGSRVWENKEKYLKERFESGDDAAMQRAVVQDMLASIVVAEQEVEFNSFLTDLVNNGSINEEEMTDYIKQAEEFEQMYIKSQMKSTDGSGRLNETGAHYLYNLMVEQKKTESAKEEILERGSKVLAAKLEGITDPETRAAITEQFNTAHNEEVEIVENKLQSLKKMQQNLMAGKKAEGIPVGYKVVGNRMVIDEESEHWSRTFVADEAGNIEIKEGQQKPETKEEMTADVLARSEGLSQAQFSQFTREGRKVSKDNVVDSAKGFFSSIAAKAKGMFNKATTKEDQDEGKQFVWKDANNVTEIDGKSFKDSDGTSFELTEAGWVKTDTEGNTSVIAGSEAVKEYNRIGAEQIERSKAKFNKEASEANGQSMVDDVAKVPTAFRIGDNVYTRKADGSYELKGSQTGVSAARAMELYNSAVQTGSISMNTEENVPRIVTEAEAAFNEAAAALENDLKGTDPRNIKEALLEIKKKLKKKFKESWEEIAPKLDGLIDQGVEALKGVGFDSLEGYNQRAAKREEARLAGEEDAEIEGMVDIYDVSILLPGGIQGVNDVAASLMPAYMGSNHSFIVQKGVQINKEVKAKFGKGVNVMLLDNINHRAGYDAVALALGSTVFITPNSYNQPRELFHEVLHVQYAINPNDAAVVEMRNRALKNPKLMAKLREDYADQIIYDVTPTYVQLQVGDVLTNVYRDGKNFKTAEGKKIEAQSMDGQLAEAMFMPQQLTAQIAGLKPSQMVTNENSTVVEAPIEQQEILMEEAYVKSMESTVAGEYDIYFTPLEQRKNKSGAAKMWTKFRSRIDKKYAANFIGEKFDEEAKAEALKSLGKMDANSNWQIGGVRFLRNYSPSQTADMQDSIEKGRMKSRRTKTQLTENEQAAREAGGAQADIEEVLENASSGPNVGVENRYAESKTAQRKLNAFLETFNQMLQKDNDIERRKLVTKSDVLVPLRLWAKKMTKEEFALHTRDANYPPTQKMIEFMDKSNAEEFGEEMAEAMTNSQLADMHKNYSTAVQTNPFQMMVREENGKMAIMHEALLNANELESVNKLVNTYHNLTRAFGGKTKTIAENIRADKRSRVVKNIESFLANPNRGYEETVMLFKDMFPSSELAHSGIMQENLFYQGKSMTFMEAFTSFLKQTSGVKKGMLYDYDAKRKSNFAEEFVRALTAANRKHTLNDVVLNPENNPTTTYNKPNYLTLTVDSMNEQLARMRAKKISLKEDGSPDMMLGNYWMKTGGIQMQAFAGIRNLAMSINQKYSRVNENAFAMSTLLRYLGEKGDSYMQTLGTAADSQMHQTIRVPKLDVKSPEAVKLAEGVNKYLGEEIFVIKDGKIKMNEGQYGQDLRKTFDFWKENFDDTQKFSELRIDPKNPQAKVNQQIANALFSNIVNKVGMQKAMFGEAAKNDNFTKRYKNANSPVTPYRKNTQLDILAVQMPKLLINEDGSIEADLRKPKEKLKEGQKVFEMNDGDSWVTVNGAEKLKHEYGEAIDIKDAGAFKTMSYAKNREGTNMEQMKTMTFVLTEEVVRNNPILRAIRSTLEARENANASNPDYFGIAATTDALKQGFEKENKNVYNTQAGLDNVYNNGNQDTMEQELTREMTESMASHNDIDGVFSGHHSPTFGIQQEMDLGSVTATMPSQLWANLLSNISEGDAMFGKATAIQAKAAQIMADNMTRKVLSKIRTGNVSPRMEDLEKIANYVHSLYANNPKVNAAQKSMAAIKSLNIPYMNETAYNTIAQNLSKAGNKIVTDGGYAFQTSEFGTVKIDADNGVQFTTTLEKDQANIPQHMALKLGLKKGDKIIASRIPHHGLQTTKVFRVNEILPSGNGSSIVVHSEFTNIIGADHDGDALFVNARPTAKMLTEAKNQGRSTKGLYDQMELFDMLSEFLSDPSIQEDATAAMDPKVLIDEAFEEGEYEKAKEDYYEGLSKATLWGEAKTYNENVPFKAMVGIAAQVHRTGQLLRGYNIEFNQPIKVGGVSKTGFSNNGVKGNKSTAFQSALLMNVILDNQSNQMGSMLGISPESISQYALMINMGFSFKQVKNFMKSEGVQAWVKVNGNRNNGLFAEKSKTDMIDKAKAIINKMNMTADEKAAAHAEIDQMAYLDDMSNDLMKVSTIMSGHNKLNGNYQILKKQHTDMKNVMSKSDVFGYNDANGDEKSHLFKLMKSKEVTRYMRSAEEMLLIHEKTNIMATPAIDEAYSAIVGSTSEAQLMGENGRTIKANVDKVVATELMMAEKMPPREYFSEIPNIIQKAKTDPTIGNNPFLKNLYIREGILSMAPQYRNADNLTEGDIKTMAYWFARMPKNVQEAIFYYDMVNHGFAGYNSFVPYMSAPQKLMLEKGANRMTLPHTRGDRQRSTGRKIAIINSDLYPKFKKEERNRWFKESRPMKTFVTTDEFFKNGRRNADLVMENKKHYITMTTNENGYNEQIVFEYQPLAPEVFDMLKEDSKNEKGYVSKAVLRKKIAGQGSYERLGKRDMRDKQNLWMINRADQQPTPPNGNFSPEFMRGLKKKPLAGQGF